VIIDTLPNAEKYFSLHPLFSKAFKFIESVNLKEVETGEYIIQETDLRAIVSNEPGVSARDSKNKMECHNQHIDIQLCVDRMPISPIDKRDYKALKKDHPEFNELFDCIRLTKSVQLNYQLIRRCVKEFNDSYRKQNRTH